MQHGIWRSVAHSSGTIGRPDGLATIIYGLEGLRNAEHLRTTTSKRKR